MDKQLLTDNITGLKAAIRLLREDERRHIKSTTLTEQIEKARVEGDGLKTELEDVRKEKAALKAEKANSLGGTAQQLQEKITALLPNGSALVRISEEGLFMGLRHHGDRVTPYLSLSGGEKVFFDLALSNAVLDGSGEKILIAEAAELDEEKLRLLMLTIEQQHPGAQILLNTCHKPEGVIPKAWHVTEVG